MRLDTMFGACEAPRDNDVKHWEVHNQPSTLRTLTRESADWLQIYLENAPKHPYSHMMASTTAILWLVDEKGSVWFALEEVVHSDKRQIALVYPRNSISLPPNLWKMGHPSLLTPGKGTAKHARCGGDIVFDPMAGKEHSWLLTNNSGRYGYRAQMRKKHLLAVQARFAELGIHLSDYYKPPLPKQELSS